MPFRPFGLSSSVFLLIVLLVYEIRCLLIRIGILIIHCDLKPTFFVRLLLEFCNPTDSFVWKTKSQCSSHMIFFDKSESYVKYEYMDNVYPHGSFFRVNSQSIEVVSGSIICFHFSTASHFRQLTLGSISISRLACSALSPKTKSPYRVWGLVEVRGRKLLTYTRR